MNAPSPRLRRGATYATCGLLTASSVSQTVTGSYGLAAACALLSGAAFFAPTLLKNVSWFGPVQRALEVHSREVWLTIDDGPEPRQTPYILEVLQKFQAKASFFTIGKKVISHPSLARRIVGEGHTLENHTFSHPENTFWFATPSRARAEIEKCSRAIEDTVGLSPRYFRAPVGFANPFVHAVAAELELKILGWSATGHDGIAHNPDSVLQKIQSSLRPGAIILMHDSHIPSCGPGSRAKTLEQLLYRLRDLGFQCAKPPLPCLR